jgi:hypothetical protein
MTDAEEMLHLYMQWSSLNQQILQYSYQLAFGEFIESTQKIDRPAQQVAGRIRFPKHEEGGTIVHTRPRAHLIASGVVVVVASSASD